MHSPPLAFYQKALSLPFPEAAHCFKRMWDRVLGTECIDGTRLTGRKTVYLKQGKQLE